MVTQIKTLKLCVKTKQETQGRKYNKNDCKRFVTLIEICVNLKYID